MKTSIYECIINEAAPSDIILKTDTPNLFLLPSHIDLVGAEIEMIHLPNREKKMKEVLEQGSSKELMDRITHAQQRWSEEMARHRQAYKVYHNL